MQAPNTITVTYAGDTHFLAGNGIAKQTVNQATPTIKTVNPVTITYGTALATCNSAAR